MKYDVTRDPTESDESYIRRLEFALTGAQSEISSMHKNWNNWELDYKRKATACWKLIVRGRKTVLTDDLRAALDC